MKRDIENFKERGKEIIERNERCDLTIGEFRQLLDNFIQIAAEQSTFDAVWKTVEDTFLLGVAVGAGCESRRQRRSRCSRTCSRDRVLSNE